MKSTLQLSHDTISHSRTIEKCNNIVHNYLQSNKRHDKPQSHEVEQYLDWSFFCLSVHSIATSVLTRRSWHDIAQDYTTVYTVNEACIALHFISCKLLWSLDRFHIESTATIFDVFSMFGQTLLSLNVPSSRSGFPNFSIFIIVIIFIFVSSCCEHWITVAKLPCLMICWLFLTVNCKHCYHARSIEMVELCVFAIDCIHELCYFVSFVCVCVWPGLNIVCCGEEQWGK